MNRTMTINRFFKDQIQNKILFIILLNLVISIPLAYFLPIWIDEAYSLQTTSKDLGYTISQSINFESQPPFYFILLYLWRSIHDSLFFGRILSVIFTVLTILFFSKLLKRIDNSWGNSWIVLLVAINPFVVWMELELRCYALVLLLSTLLIYFFYLGFFIEKSEKKYLIAYILASVISLYSHYYLGYLLVANAAVLLIFKRWRELGYYLIAMLVVTLCFIPYLAIIQKQLVSYADYSRNIFSLIGGLKLIIHRIEDYYLAIHKLAMWPLMSWVLRLLVAILLLIQLRKIYLNKEKIKNNYEFMISSVIMISIISLFFMLTLNVVGETIIRYRHTSVLFIPTLIFFIVTFSSFINEDRLRYYLLIWHILIIFLYSYVLFIEYQPMSKSGDWKRVASFVQKEEKPNQPILIFRSELQPPFEYHYKGINKIIPIPKPIDYSKLDYSQYAIKSENELKNIFEHLPDEIHNYWLITDILESYLGVNFNKQLLEDYINDHFDIVSIKKFGGTHIRFIKPKI